VSTDDWARIYVVLALVDIVVTIVLVRAARREKEAALAERATVSVLLTLFAVATAVLSAAYLVDVPVPNGITSLIILGALAVISLPQILWYASYRMRRFE